MRIIIAPFVLTVLVGNFANGQTNKFEGTVGCRQYNTNDGYYYALPYFATSGFRNLKVDRNGVKRMRMGVLGNNDGILRLAPVQFPYNNTVMHEIVLSGVANTQTMARRYTRTQPDKFTDHVELLVKPTIGMMSQFEPLMFTLAVHPDGTVELTRDDDSLPLLEFVDSSLSTNYLGFCNWNSPVVVFYDCPLKRDESLCEGVVYRKKCEEISCSLK